MFVIMCEKPQNHRCFASLPPFHFIVAVQRLHLSLAGCMHHTVHVWRAHTINTGHSNLKNYMAMCAPEVVGPIVCCIHFMDVTQKCAPAHAHSCHFSVERIKSQPKGNWRPFESITIKLEIISVWFVRDLKENPNANARRMSAIVSTIDWKFVRFFTAPPHTPCVRAHSNRVDGCQFWCVQFRLKCVIFAENIVKSPHVATKQQD